MASEISSLYGVLSHLQTEISNPGSLVNTGDMDRRLELENHVKGCEHHLRRISSVLVKFNALPEDERRDRNLWQKVRFGNGSVKDIAQIRTKLTTYTTAISMSLQILSLGSQGRIERKLNRQSGEMQGLRERIDLLVAKRQGTQSAEGSIMTNYTHDDKHFWRGFRRELVKDGYPSRVIHAHKDLIQDYVRELGSRGILDELAGRLKLSLQTPENGASIQPTAYDTLETDDQLNSSGSGTFSLPPNMASVTAEISGLYLGSPPTLAVVRENSKNYNSRQKLSDTESFEIEDHAEISGNSYVAPEFQRHSSLTSTADLIHQISTPSFLDPASLKISKGKDLANDSTQLDLLDSERPEPVLSWIFRCHKHQVLSISGLQTILLLL